MKQDETKTTGYETIKAKTLQFPPGLIDIKPSIRSNPNADAFDVSTSSYYALRFLTSSSSHEALRSRVSKSTATPSNLKEGDDKRLPPVELTINKKIKFPHDKKRLSSREDFKLTSSDRDIIEELRHQLRTQPHNGTTSVLEAIGDPQVRENRFYYEPLSSFLQGKEVTEVKSFADSGLRVVNIMIPSLEKGMPSETGLILPFTLSRHQAAASRNASRFRGNGGTNISYLPKVIGNSLATKSDSDGSLKTSLRFYNPEIPGQNFEGVYPQVKPRRDHVPAGAHYPRKAQLNLPRIGIKRDDVDDADSKARYKRRKGVATVGDNQLRQKAATVQLPTRREEEGMRVISGFPRRATTTATGKAHLIGPMNKMDMIADYSRALQSGLITYNEYMKKLSVLSLHKVNISSSTQRHFHLVRDESHNMKPRLTHVDVNPKTLPQSNSAQVELGETRKINRPNLPRDKALKALNGTASEESITEGGSDKAAAGSKTAQPRLHRVDIGEGLTLFEESKPSFDVITDEIIMPDLARYTHVHHPRQGRLAQFHWNHEVGSLPGVGAETWGGSRSLHWPSNSSEKVKADQQRPHWKVGESPREDKEAGKKKTKVLLSMEEYLKLHSPNHKANASQDKQKNGLSVIGEYDEAISSRINPDMLAPIQDSLTYGKIPYSVGDSEKLGLGAKDIVRAVDFRLPMNVINTTEAEVDEVSDVDSLFQSHLDNMLNTIKKAKANKKKKVPELRGLVPTVIPQVRVEKAGKEDCKQEKEKEKETGNNVTSDSSSTESGLLAIQKQIPDNTPPPSADPSSGSFGKPKTPEAKLEAKLNVVSPTPPADGVRIIVDKSNSQLIVNQVQSGPSTPRSVQRNRSPRFTPNDGERREKQAPESNTEIRIMTASVDLVAPEEDGQPGSQANDRSRLEVVITSMPVAPPASLATTSDDGDDLD